MKELEKNELMLVDGGYVQKIIGLGGDGHQHIYFLDYSTGRLYDITGKLVYQYPGEW